MTEATSISYEENAQKLSSSLLAKVLVVKRNSGRCRIFIHGNVDGDCIGSSTCMCLLLRMLGIPDTYIMIDEDLPYDMEYLGISDLLRKDEEVSLSENDLAIAVDCSVGSRMAGVGDIFDNAPTKIIIDHHKSVTLSGDGIWVEPDASSASELCWYVFCEAKKSPMYKEDSELVSTLAMALLTGVVTDTGRFTYRNTRPETLRVAGDLMALGGDISTISYNQFDRKKVETFRISALAQSKAEFFCEGRLAIVAVTDEMFSSCNAPHDGIGDVVSKLRDVDGVEVAFVLRETGNGNIRVNIRSRDYFDCSVYAEGYGGGGHVRASGFTVSDMDIYSLEKKIVKEVSELL